MRSLGLSLFIVLFVSLTGFGQVKIGDNPQNIDPSAVLELESTTKALIITRVTTAQMEAIGPSVGALVYNTDLGCVHYYNGAAWVNLCVEGNVAITTEPIVNSLSTIVLTPTGDGNNLEVAPNSIRSEQIVDGGVNGVDIQNNSIGPNKLADNSVNRDKLSENAVGLEALDTDEVTLGSLINDAGFITSAEVVSPDPANDITDNGGAFFDQQPLVDAIAGNTAAIAADGDTNANNEIQSLGLNGNLLSITGSNTIDLGFFDNSGTDNQTLALNSNILGISNGNTVNLSAYVNTDNQVLAITGNQLSISGGNVVTIPASNGSDTQIIPGTGIAITGNGTIATPYQITNTFTEGDGSITNELQDLNFDNATNILTLTNPATPGNQVDLSALAGGGGSTELADQLTIVGDGTPGNEFEVADGSITTAKIQPLTPAPATDYMLVTTPAGTVGWAPVGAIGSTEEADGITITGLGTNADPFKIEPGANGQFLSTSAGTVIWDNLPGGVGGTVVADNLTIEGNGVLPNPLQVRDGGITTDQIADATITPIDIQDNAVTLPKLAVGNAPGQLMQWNGTTWVLVDDSTLGITEADGIVGNEITNATDGTLVRTGAGTLASPFTLDVAAGQITDLELANNAVTLPKLAAGTAAGQLMQWNGTAWVLVDDSTLGVTEADGIIGNEVTNATDGTLIRTGAGTVASPYTLDVAAGQITNIEIGDNAVTTTKILNGTIAAVDLADGAITTTKILDGQVQTADIADNNVTPAKIAPGGGDQILRTNVAGTAVAWVDLPAGGAVSSDGATIVGDGSATDLSVPTGGITTTQIFDLTVAATDIAGNAITTPKILDANVTPPKIAPGGGDQILRTNAAGTAVAWVDLPAGGAVSSDGTTIVGDGSSTDLSVPTGGITTAQILDGSISASDIGINAVTTPKILDANVTPPKIAPGTDGQVLTTVAGNTQWASPTAGAVQTTAAIDGDGQAGAPLDLADNAVTTTKILDGQVQTVDIADNNVTPAKIQEGASGQVLTTDGTGNVIWAAATAGASTTGTTIDGDGTIGAPLEIANNAVNSGRIQDGQVQTVDIADNNVTEAKINPSATNGQVLTTVAGNVQWAAPTSGSQNLFEADFLMSSDRTHDLGGNDFVLGGTGNVAIGNITPQDKLDVDGQIRARNGFASTEGTEGNPGYGFYTSGDTDTGIYRIAENQLGITTGGTQAIRIIANQFVGIGNINPLERLHVGGNIRADGAFISNTTTIQVPDYVFEKYFKGTSNLNKEYRFQTLAEIEAFVKKNHHLPGIKSAAQVKKEGFWNLSESNLQNLEKIEELYLHTIEQQKAIDHLKKENDDTEKELESLRKELEAIKKLIKKTH